MTHSRHGILVGVTGTGQDVAALGWAAERAALTGARVTLVHAYGHVLPPPPPSVLLAPEPVTEAAAYLMTGCVETYLHLAPAGTDKPEAIVDGGRPTHVLEDLSKEADVVVLTHRERGHRLLTGSTTASVATHAHCPTVAVPDGWSPTPTHEARWVTVGVHELGEPTPVLRAAVDESVLAGAPLRLVHGWHLDSVYDDIVSARVDPAWRSAAEDSLRAAVEPLLVEHPGLEVETHVLHEWPVEALVQRAPTSRLLVVGRHAHRTARPQRLGSVARTVVRASTCPVMVVPV